jgi:hypothetical protein
MEAAIAVLALAAAVAAWVRLAALSKAVARTSAAAAAGDRERAPALATAADDDALRRRVEDLEARCLALESRPSALAPAAPAPAERSRDESSTDAVRRHLEERGFEEVSIQGEGNPRSPLRIEAVRGGTVYKGQVDASTPGALEERLRPARRAFP